MTTSRWSVSASTETLIELYRLLDGMPPMEERDAIQKEIVSRARAAKLSTKQIIATLVAGVGSKRARGAIAKEWSLALGISESEARRLAG